MPKYKFWLDWNSSSFFPGRFLLFLPTNFWFSWATFKTLITYHLFGIFVDWTEDSFVTRKSASCNWTVCLEIPILFHKQDCIFFYVVHLNWHWILLKSNVLPLNFSQNFVDQSYPFFLYLRPCLIFIFWIWFYSVVFW